MDWIMGIQRALDYTEAHLTDEIDYEAVAKQAYSSAFHFQRMFSMLCGFSLGDYIRMRRLSLAADELYQEVTQWTSRHLFFRRNGGCRISVWNRCGV